MFNRLVPQTICPFGADLKRLQNGLSARWESIYTLKLQAHSSWLSCAELTRQSRCLTIVVRRTDTTITMLDDLQPHSLSEKFLHFEATASWESFSGQLRSTAVNFVGSLSNSSLLTFGAWHSTSSPPNQTDHRRCLLQASRTCVRFRWTYQQSWYVHPFFFLCKRKKNQERNPANVSLLT